jgi:hypothetical protein
MGARRSTQRRTGNMSKISRCLACLHPAFAPRPCAYPTDIPQALFDSPTVTRRDVLSTRTSGTRHSPALRTRFHMPRARRVKSRRRSCPPPPAPSPSCPSIAPFDRATWSGVISAGGQRCHSRRSSSGDAAFTSAFSRCTAATRLYRWQMPRRSQDLRRRCRYYIFPQFTRANLSTLRSVVNPA